MHHKVCCRSFERIFHCGGLPVSFCQELSEYHLEMEGGYALLRYCPFCGAQLPESTRDSLHLKMDEKELREIEDIVHIMYFEELCNRLGPPTESVQNGEDTQHSFKKWNTVDLIVLQSKDGALQYTAVPKPKE